MREKHPGNLHSCGDVVPERRRFFLGVLRILAGNPGKIYFEAISRKEWRGPFAHYNF